MATDTKMSNAAVNAEADALAALANGGFILFYSGTKPATADTAVTDQVLLAELGLGDPAFGAAVDGVITANPITPDSSANASGTATWFRVVTSGGGSLWDGTVGTSGANINLNSVEISAGALVGLSAFSHTVTK